MLKGVARRIDWTPIVSVRRGWGVSVCWWSADVLSDDECLESKTGGKHAVYISSRHDIVVPQWSLLLTQP
jgi:hypothetical protein